MSPLPRFMAVLTVGVLSAACTTDARSPAEPLASEALAARGASSTANADLAALRRATAPFQRHDLAVAAGYDVQFPEGCMESEAGAQAFHYIDLSSVGTLDVTRPQLLMYEPQANGKLNLVGVEYIYPGTPADDPPVLFGREFGWSEVYGVWVLHVWAWRGNPDPENGIFANWNRLVSCRYAEPDALSAARHH